MAQVCHLRYIGVGVAAGALGGVAKPLLPSRRPALSHYPLAARSRCWHEPAPARCDVRSPVRQHPRVRATSAPKQRFRGFVKTSP